MLLLMLHVACKFFTNSISMLPIFDGCHSHDETVVIRFGIKLIIAFKCAFCYSCIIITITNYYDNYALRKMYKIIITTTGFLRSKAPF